MAPYSITVSLDTLNHARRHGPHVLIPGDFNVHSESWLGSSKTTPAGEYTEELCAVHGLQQHVQCATRGSGRNRLDLVLSDLEERVSIKPTNPIGSSDHVTLLASINTKPFREKRTERLVWQYQKADWGKLRNFLKDVSWHRIMRDDPERACDAVTMKILDGMQQFTPSQKLVTSPSDPSWWTPECTAAVRAKQFSCLSPIDSGAASWGVAYPHGFAAFIHQRVNPYFHQQGHFASARAQQLEVLQGRSYVSANRQSRSLHLDQTSATGGKTIPAVC